MMFTGHALGAASPVGFVLAGSTGAAYVMILRLEE
jgi:hypothetical protein